MIEWESLFFLCSVIEKNNNFSIMSDFKRKSYAIIFLEISLSLKKVHWYFLMKYLFDEIHGQYTQVRSIVFHAFIEFFISFRRQWDLPDAWFWRTSHRSFLTEIEWFSKKDHSVCPHDSTSSSQPHPKL